MLASCTVEIVPFTSIQGILVGHAEANEFGSGCSVLLSSNPKGFIMSVDVRGGAPATKETDLLKPGTLVERCNAVVLSGGSAFGLEASNGVMKYLREKGVGVDTGCGIIVPIVCQASLYDLKFIRCKENIKELLNVEELSKTEFILPDYKELGYKACQQISEKDLNGNVGAGLGCSVGKLAGMHLSMKGGLGQFAVKINDIQIGAMVAVNALGEIIDEDGQVIAGIYENGTIGNSLKVLLQEMKQTSECNKQKNELTTLPHFNTTIAVVVTNVSLNKTQANRIACMAQDAYARRIRPSHLMRDGDSIFVVSTDALKLEDVNLDVLGSLSCEVLERAILNGVKFADSLKGVISHKDIVKMTVNQQ
ncbi:hypothetical protein ABK040_016085 [Willaertia magna]